MPAAVRADAKALFKERVEKELGPLLDATMRAACGEQLMFGLDEVAHRWRLITDAPTIERLLNSGESFYRIATKSPDARVLVDVWDRIIGKPSQPVEHGGDLNLKTTVVHEYRPN